MKKSIVKIIRLLPLVGLAMLGLQGSGQQLPLYSQYVFNKFLINPATAGSDGFTSYNITAREQWIGYTGAPRTYSVSYQTRVLKRKFRIKHNVFDNTVFVPKNEGKVGFGGYIFADRNGLIQKTGFQTSYSYHAWLADYTQMSLGIGLSGYFYRINVNETSFESPDDPLLNNDLLRRGVFIPDVDFGIYILNPMFDVGFSALQLVGAAAKIGNSAYNNYWMSRHYYLFASYNLRVGEKGQLEPAALVKMSEQMRPQVDIGANYIQNQAFWAGLTYRTDGAVIANIRFKVIPSRINMTSLFFGYAFDFTLNKIQRVTYGTHEFTLAVKFGDSAKRFRWLDRY